MEIKIYKPISKSKDIPLRDIFWYDHFYKKMNIFNCHFLKYSYILEKYIIIDNKNLSLKDVINTVQETNKCSKGQAEDFVKNNFNIQEKYMMIAQPEIIKDKNEKISQSISKWYDTYSNYNDIVSEIVDKDDISITFDVKEDNVNDFCYDLERNNIRFETIEDGVKI